jgi:hypothetical protein
MSECKKLIRLGPVVQSVVPATQEAETDHLSPEQPGQHSKIPSQKTVKLSGKNRKTPPTELSQN